MSPVFLYLSMNRRERVVNLQNNCWKRVQFEARFSFFGRTHEVSENLLHGQDCILADCFIPFITHSLSLIV